LFLKLFISAKAVTIISFSVQDVANILIRAVDQEFRCVGHLYGNNTNSGSVLI